MLIHDQQQLANLLRSISDQWVPGLADLSDIIRERIGSLQAAIEKWKGKLRPVKVYIPIKPEKAGHGRSS